MKNFVNRILKKITFLLSMSVLFISCGNAALTGTDSGSLIEDRSGGLIMTFVIILVVLLAVISGIFLLSKKIVSYKTSPEYIEKQKRRPTSVSDVNNIAKEAMLSKDEKDLLWRICKEHKTPNIEYLVKDSEHVESILKQQFNSLDIANDEENKANLFSLRKKLFRAFKQQIIIKNTKALDNGTVFTYTQTKGFHHKLNMVNNDSEDFILSIPKTLEQSNDLPGALSKINLIFEDKDSSPYEIETRIMRYQDGKDGDKQMIVVHTDKVIPLKKRQAERLELQLPCKFSSVKASTDNKKGTSHYETAEKEHDGTLEDVSVGGCRIITNLPIKPDQFIFIKGRMNRKDMDSAIGKIVRTTKRNDNLFILHVKFLKIDISTTNRIQAVVCGYDS